MVGKENSSEFSPKDAQFFKQFALEADYRLSTALDLPKQIENFEKRKLGRAMVALFYEEKEESIEIVDTERIGYILPSEVDDSGRVTENVIVLKSGFIMVTEPRSDKKKHIKKYQDLYPNTLPFAIELPNERRDEYGNDVPNVLESYAKITKSSNNESQVPNMLEKLDQATVTAWNLQESRERGLKNSAKGAVTVFEGFFKEYDKQVGDMDLPPNDSPPQPTQ